MRLLSTYVLFVLILTSYVSAFAAAPIAEQYKNSVGIEFVLIPAGTFTMGANSEIEDSYDFEEHRHNVTISQPFYMGKYEVTQKQWEDVMGNNPSFFKHPDYPVEMVTFEDVQLFINSLNEREGTTKYRLPTEAEWEYAARAGSSTTFFFGDDELDLEQYAWYEKNSGGEPHPVGKKKPNAWGLYDMIGNINEYVQDWFDENYYLESPTVDPTGPVSGTRLKRGGSWFGPPKHNRVAFRDGVGPEKSDKRGFRLAVSTK